jgi:hypothetical protein
MDILVIPEARLQEVANQPGLVYREALRHGQQFPVSEKVEEQRGVGKGHYCA